ncbi:MAG: PilZ domain-containing protein [Mariprofundaceae bacterium]
MSESRNFIRHPVDIPVNVLKQSQKALPDTVISNIGEGGVAFLTAVAFVRGALLDVCIPHTKPIFNASGVVCWCRSNESGFEVGVRFLDEDSRFRARMVQQVCHIEDYRQKAKNEGRSLSADVAASEWISLYAAEFGGR